MAVKIVNAESISEQKRLFLLEARLLQVLKHDCIVEILGVVLNHLPMMMITEYMENSDLVTFLRRCSPDKLSAFYNFNDYYYNI